MDVLLIICSVSVALFKSHKAHYNNFQHYPYGSDFLDYVDNGVIDDKPLNSTKSEADDYENIDCHHISSKSAFDQFQPYNFYDIESVFNLTELPYQATCTTFDPLKYYRDLSFPDENVLLTVRCTDTGHYGFFKFDFNLERYALFTKDDASYGVHEGTFELMELTKEELGYLAEQLIHSALPIVSNPVQTKSKYSCQNLTMRDNEIYTKIESSYRYYLSWVVCNGNLSLEMESNAYLDSCGTPFNFGFSGLSPDRTSIMNTENTKENKSLSGAAWKGSPMGTNKSGGHSKPKILTEFGSNGNLFRRYKTNKGGMIIHTFIDQESRPMASPSLSLQSLLFLQIYLKFIF